MSSFLNFCTYIDKHAETLSEEIVNEVIQTMQLDLPEWEKEQAIRTYVDLLRFLGKSLINDEQDEHPETLIEWSNMNSEQQLLSGGDITEIIARYAPTRDIFHDWVTKTCIELDMSVREHAHILKRINNLLDISLNETLTSYIHLANAYKDEAQKKLLKLSAPIVPIKDGVIVLPLIGHFDKENARHIMDNVVPDIAEMVVDYVIVDLSGIPSNYAEITGFLDQLKGILQLMGVHLIITGLRPEMAQTIVHNGVDMSESKVFATVKQAVESL